MSGIEGQWFEGARSSSRSAILQREGDVWKISCNSHPPALHATEDTVVSERLGSVPRRLEFPDGSQFTTPDNEGIDALLGDDQPGGARHVDRMERRWAWALVAVLAIPVLLWGLFTLALPLVAKPVAEAFPAELVEAIDRSTMEWLDNEVFQNSALPIQRQREVQHLVEQLPGSDGIHIEVRSSELLGPNALALPGGTVVFTDAMIELADNDHELLAVLAHEVGHVRERHGLRNLVQSTGVAAVMGWVAGDLTLVTDLVLVSAPTVLQQQAYSRTFEREADTSAMALLEDAGLPPDCLADLFERLDHWIQNEELELPSWLSTHPTLQERIEAARTGRACP